MSQQDILRFEEAGKVTIAGHTLDLTDIKIVRVFKRYGLKDTEIDANGDGTGLVTLSISFVYYLEGDATGWWDSIEGV
ncbi:unnamed protein product [Brassica oleracea]